MMPSFTSGSPNCALSLAMRRWQASASSHPPPSANPFTAAITGLRDSSMRRNTCWPSRLTSIPSTGPILDSSAMSAPATNAFSPTPVRITPPTSSRPVISSNAWPSSRMVCSFSAFSFSGRFTDSTAIRSCTSSVRLLYSGMVLQRVLEMWVRWRRQRSRGSVDRQRQGHTEEQSNGGSSSVALFLGVNPFTSGRRLRGDGAREPGRGQRLAHLRQLLRAQGLHGKARRAAAHAQLVQRGLDAGVAQLGHDRLVHGGQALLQPPGLGVALLGEGAGGRGALRRRPAGGGRGP